LRGGKARGDPDCVNAKVFQVVELGGDSLEIADAVVVAVGEAPRVQLIKDGVLPSFIALSVDFLLLGTRVGHTQKTRKTKESWYG